MENIAPESPTSDTMLVDKPSPSPPAATSPKPDTTPSPDPDAFGRQVEKLVGVLTNSDGSEIADAVQHVARAMSTFTAAERAEFITHLIIMYCEARREDQPKIILLIKELSKKNVLAKTHFFQSAKKITADIAQLTVDWPNIYDCATFLIYTCLEMIDKSTETLRGLETILGKAGEPHAAKFLDGFHRFCHLPADGSAPLPRKSLTPGDLHARPPAFVRPAETVRDRLIRPLSQVDSEKAPRRVTYTREVLLAIEQRVRAHGAQPRLVALLSDVIKKEGVRKEEREGGGKRPRYVSESAVGSEMGAKRLLESTSPVLPMIIGEGHGRSHFEKFAPAPRHIILPSRTDAGDSSQHLAQSPSKHAARDYLGHPFQRFDIPRNGPVNENTRPHFHPQHPAGQGQPGFIRQPHFRSSYSVSEPTAAAAGDGHRMRQQPAANAKTKKFLTALSVERDSDAGPESPPVTLGPGERTWARGSGSLKPLTSQRKNTDENWRREAS
ncbi:uncharacterized protein LOC129582546 isoform X2 [Paramacrobiotus metropolitanus]|nr:uncharacterized protein LOC129582546 isoform X2 [Paramacrobiotus metropolitanus]XP_055330039.1 uncharacterized protein LOC129582546 isoform X2 [Paramacrobiotus metropolitanus]XP_055330041.1 uncharacterized protein LOC129582546 isoform X2 [Paramacrobiotus metropolitanus]XP_055330042.1 uncharacterized protein LOC129582546 isoform X2 [Paramacrobiotus metropolitanus]